MIKFLKYSGAMILAIFPLLVIIPVTVFNAERIMKWDPIFTALSKDVSGKGVLFFMIYFLLVYVIGFFIVCQLVFYFQVSMRKKSKDLFADFMYDVEEKLHLKHRHYMSGDEWAEKWRIRLEKMNGEKDIHDAFKKADDYFFNNQSNEDNNLNNSELEKAMNAFFLDDLNVSREELKKIRNRLMKACHSDNNGSDEMSNTQSQKINEYYQILLSRLK